HSKYEKEITMNRIHLSILGILVVIVLTSCSDSFLNNNPKGTISGEQLNTPARIDQMVIAAYASLGNDHWNAPYSSLWASGSVRSDDAYKGGGGGLEMWLSPINTSGFFLKHLNWQEQTVFGMCDMW